MAFRHKAADRAAAGAVTQAEFDSATAHWDDAQVAGDIWYAPGATGAPTRLPIGGAEGRLLVVSSANLPEWVKGFTAMGRWLREGWKSRIYSFTGSTEVVTGSGATLLDNSAFAAHTSLGATHASTAGRLLIINASNTTGGNYGIIDFTKPLWMFAFLYTDGGGAFANTTMRFYLEDGNPGTLNALAGHGFGISAAAGAISLATRGSGGSEVLVASSPAKSFITGGGLVGILIEHNPATYTRLYIDGTLVAEQTTAASIPSTTGTATARVKLAIVRSGGADTSNNRILLVEAYVGGTYA